jgi:hypothetical protein
MVNSRHKSSSSSCESFERLEANILWTREARIVDRKTVLIAL